jgi:hypothetical protein
MPLGERQRCGVLVEVLQNAKRFGEVVERLKALAWKASRGDKPLEGSNPSLSDLTGALLNKKASFASF